MNALLRDGARALKTGALAIVAAPALAAGALAVPGSAAAQTPPAEPVRVVVTQPVYAALTRAVGGDHVQVVALTSPAEDPHTVRPKPSYAVEIRRADLFVTTGLDLELWVPPLLDRAGNSQVMETGPGYVTAYTGIRLLDIPAVVDRGAGDVHIYGNPHLHTDPLRAVQVARNIATGLKRVAPDRAAAIDANLARFTDEIHRRLFGDELVDLLGAETLVALAESNRLFSFLEENELDGRPLTEWLGGWLAESAAFRGRDVICYHKNWSYLEERFDVDCTAYVESKPGIPPTPRHVRELLELMEQQGVTVVLAANYFDPRKVETVARRGRATAVVVPLALAADDDQAYFELVDTWVRELSDAFSSAAATTVNP
jgi:ABC-type Zn uptake system ZnuABC Zn-binding protein ZnuA